MPKVRHIIYVVFVIIGCKHEPVLHGEGLTYTAYASRSIETKHALIEMYTNASNPYTADAYDVYEEIKSAAGSKIHLIRMEANPVSTTGFFPNFKTKQGDSLVERMEIGATPVGVINRTGFVGKSISGFSPAMRREFWQSTIEDVIALPSKVNIGGLARLDRSSHKLTIETELYYTDDEELPCQLHLALMESNIIQPQQNSGSFYAHNNVLCLHITGTKGEDIDAQLTTGSSIFRKRTVTLPFSFFQNSHGHNIAANPDNFTLLAFVTQNSRKIENVAEIPIAIN